MKSIQDNIKELGYNEDIEKNLKKNYNTALKGEAFKKLIEKLNIDENILKNYTSLLEESAQEYHNCQNCKSILECKNKMCGYAYLPKLSNNELIFKYKACKYKKKFDEQTKYLENINVFGSSTYLKDAKMKDIYTNDKNRIKPISWIVDFIDKYPTNPHQKGLYLYGNFGCGKTYLLSACFNELAKAGYKSTIVFWPEFLRDLKASFQSDYNEKYEIVKRSPILLIDDIGAEVITQWARDEIVCPLVQYRMEHKLPTFFTSNLTLDQLKEHLSVTKDGIDVIKAGRIIERIKELTENLELVSKNLRN